jgi:hypothetical protein
MLVGGGSKPVEDIACIERGMPTGALPHPFTPTRWLPDSCTSSHGADG